MKNHITIGRSSHCDIIIPDESISREHARLSVVNGQYIYEDFGRNGSVLCGQNIRGKRLAITPGADILLAGRIPLPWAQIYTLLPLNGANPYSDRTKIEPTPNYQSIGKQPAYNQPDNYEQDTLAVGWGILAFLIPLIGWVMYFVWKDATPSRASKAAGLAWAGFILNIIIFSAV